MCPHHVWLFLHQGQQHLPARLHCSHGNTSKQQPDRQKQEMQRGKNKAVILFTLSHISVPSSQRRSPKWNTVCRCCFRWVKTPGTRASHSGGTNCPLRMSFSRPSIHILTIWRYSSGAERERERERDGTGINPKCPKAYRLWLQHPIKTALTQIQSGTSHWGGGGRWRGSWPLQHPYSRREGVSPVHAPQALEQEIRQ